MRSKHSSRAHGRRPQRHMPPHLAPREVLRRLFRPPHLPTPYLAWPTAYGDPVPPEWRVFEAEAEDALRRPHRVRVRR